MVSLVVDGKPVQEAFSAEELVGEKNSRKR